MDKSSEYILPLFLLHSCINLPLMLNVVISKYYNKRVNYNKEEVLFFFGALLMIYYDNQTKMSRLDNLYIEPVD